MQDYSDIIFLMAAMLVFSLFTLQANRVFQQNNQAIVQTQIEYNAVAVAQGQVDVIRWIKDEQEFNQFTGEFPKTETVSYGSSAGDTMSYNLDLRVTPLTVPGTTVTTKKVEVVVTNRFLKANPLLAEGIAKEVILYCMKSFSN